VEHLALYKSFPAALTSEPPKGSFEDRPTMSERLGRDEGNTMAEDHPLGVAVENWTPPAWPERRALHGRYAVLEPLNAGRHAEDLHRANRADDGIWDYLPYGPYASIEAYRLWVDEASAGEDPHFHAILDTETGHYAGVLSYLRIQPQAGSIEIGHVNFSAELQRTRAATEAVVLLADWAFGAGYRRLEWKCNTLNLASRRAAQRLGLSYEGVFRQHSVVKGRNRDTAWFAAVDGEWPALRAAYDQWLAPENFDAAGRQRVRLSDLTRPVLVARDPALV